MRPVRIKDIDATKAKTLFRAIQPPGQIADVNSAVQEVNNVMFKCAKHARKDEGLPTTSWDAPQRRWQRLMEEDDQRQLWKAINWNGDIREDCDQDGPSDGSRLLNATLKH